MRVISGSLGGRRYIPPTQPGLRPMTDLLRESFFNILENRMELEGIRFLDLFSGSGSMSWEVLSRGAEASVAVELNATNVAFIRQTAENFGVASRITIKRQRVEQFLAQDTERFPLVFLDPPYKLGTKAQLAGAVLSGAHLTEGGLLVMHHPSQENYSGIPGFQEQRVYGGAAISFFGGAEA